MSIQRFLILPIFVFCFLGCSEDEPDVGVFEVQDAFTRSVEINLGGEITEDIPIDGVITLVFSSNLNENSLENGITLSTDDGSVAITTRLSSQKNTAIISPVGVLKDNTVHTLSLSEQVKSEGGTSLLPLAFSFRTRPNELEILSANIDGQNVTGASTLRNVNRDLSLTLDFSTSVNLESFDRAFRLSGADWEVSASNENRTLRVTSTTALDYWRKYEVTISDELESTAGRDFEGFSFEFFTALDSSFKFPEITDEELLTKVQEQTFKYFWDFAHPVSGLARERNTSGNLVTIGGSGFGVMSILVGIERGFITRQEGVDRLETIVNFLENADRFHGVWPHWMDGTTGETIPFSANDDGADLVETAFMIQGLLTARAYLDEGNAREAGIKAKITTLWEAVEWDWFTQGGQDVLYWHWSPNFGWEKNLPISGWNESLIIYVLAAASPTHPIDASVYHRGWAREGNMQNGNEFYGTTLPLGPDRGGPLFFAHYSFLGLDPRNLEDTYANYWTQNFSHTAINRLYCIDNPLNFIGYSTACWGLTASDNQSGYSAHSPNNDQGVITPTAAISSLPYSPQESMQAIRHFYYILGDKIWGDYGFADAFNFTAQWVADSFLAIDQGPIIIMIENHRTALLWDLFMTNPEISAGLDKLGFTSY